MLRWKLLAALLFIVLPASAAAAQAITVIHSNDSAVRCYRAALNEDFDRRNIASCDTALDDPSLTTRNRVATHVNRGILYVHNGDFDQAIADYDAAIRLDPEEPEAYLNKGLAVLRLRDWARAAALLTQAIDLDTRVPAIAHLSRSYANELSGDIEAAYYDAVRAAELAPEWAAAADNLSRFSVGG